jgi:hypothetical protein
MKIPAVGEKLVVDLKSYAAQNGLMYANIPLTDGRSVMVLDNGVHVVRNPKLSTSISLYEINDGDKIVLSKSNYVGPSDGAIEYVSSILKKFQAFSKSKKDMCEQMLDQFYDSISEII